MNSTTITPEMLAAGVHVLAEQHGVASEYVAEEIAEEVFRAMIAASVCSAPNGDDSKDTGRNEGGAGRSDQRP